MFSNYHYPLLHKSNTVNIGVASLHENKEAMLLLPQQIYLVGIISVIWKCAVRLLARRMTGSVKLFISLHFNARNPTV